jgi:hypothetical protein
MVIMKKETAKKVEGPRARPEDCPIFNANWPMGSEALKKWREANRDPVTGYVPDPPR